MYYMKLSRCAEPKTYIVRLVTAPFASLQIKQYKITENDLKEIMLPDSKSDDLIGYDYDKFVALIERTHHKAARAVHERFKKSLEESVADDMIAQDHKRREDSADEAP